MLAGAGAAPMTGPAIKLPLRRRCTSPRYPEDD